MGIFNVKQITFTKEQRNFLKYVYKFHNSIGFVCVKLHLNRNYYTIDQYGRRCANFMGFIRAWKRFTSRDANEGDLLKYGTPQKYLR